MAAEFDPSLTRLRVLRLEETDRVKRLQQLASYYDQSQNDHLDTDWEGYRRRACVNYLESRLDPSRYQPAGAETAPYGYRRPTCPTMLVGHVVDTYTALLLGEGRSPALRVIGDETSTEFLHALFTSSGSWATLAAARKIMGSVGAVAVVPEVIDGTPTVRVIRPEHTYVEWENSADWVPRVLIEQKLVAIEHLDESGRVCETKVWRTRAWTATHVYVYKDLAERERTEDEEDDKQDAIELDGEPQEHGASRCPCIWIQNTHDPESPYGEPDCKPVLEQIDQLDRLQSMLVRGAKSNVDPTLVVKDKMQMLARWPTRKKGWGQMIEVSEAGDAKLLEISGESVETSWTTHENVRRQIDMRVGVITIDPEVAGKMLSGLAIRLIYWTQDTRAGARRTPLGKGIEQLARVWLEMAGHLGVRMPGESGQGIELPPREVRAEPKSETKPGEAPTPAKLERHPLGPGKAITLNWPLLHSATPNDIQTVLQALAVATNGQPVLSQESAVELAINVLELGVDVPTELGRIRADRDAKVSQFESAMLPDAGEDGEPDEDGADGSIQSKALSGGQIKEFRNTVEAVGSSLAPGAAQIIVDTSLTSVPSDQVKKAIDEQLKFVEEKREDEPDPPAIDPAQQAAGLAKAQAVKADEQPDEEEDGDA